MASLPYDVVIRFLTNPMPSVSRIEDAPEPIWGERVIPRAEVIATLRRSTTYRVNNGVLYQRTRGKDGFWEPAQAVHDRPDITLEAAGVKEARFDASAPLLCRCGSMSFAIKTPVTQYETSACCMKCGLEEVIASY